MYGHDDGVLSVDIKDLRSVPYDPFISVLSIDLETSIMNVQAQCYRGAGGL